MLGRSQNLYLATVIDCYSRRLVGWSIADHMRTELVEDALKAAAATRGSLAGAVFHSDHGSVYTSKDFAKLCAALGVTQSMGAVGSSADNALAESFNATLKREVLQDAATWPDETTCRREVFRWLIRYNTQRRHSHCRHQSPITYETTTPLRSRQRHNPTPCPRPGGKAPHRLGDYSPADPVEGHRRRSGRAYLRRMTSSRASGHTYHPHWAGSPHVRLAAPPRSRSVDVVVGDAGPERPGRPAWWCS